MLRTVLSPAHTRWTCAKASLWYSAYRWRHHDVERRDYRPKRQRATSPETFIPTAHAPARRPGFLPWSRHVPGGTMLPLLPSPGIRGGDGERAGKRERSALTRSVEEKARGVRCLRAARHTRRRIFWSWPSGWCGCRIADPPPTTTPPPGRLYSSPKNHARRRCSRRVVTSPAAGARPLLLPSRRDRRHRRCGGDAHRNPVAVPPWGNGEGR